MQQYILIDITDKRTGSYICQMRYPKPPLYPLYPICARELRQFVNTARPSLAKRNINIALSNQKVYQR